MEFLLPVDPLSELRRLYREACLHRFANEPAAAADILENALPAHFKRLQETDTTGALNPQAVQRALEEEYRRIVDAEVLGELLLPRLKRALAQPGAGPRAESSSASSPAPAAREASGPQSISDMLDSMLSQQAPAGKRRR